MHPSYSNSIGAGSWAPIVGDTTSGTFRGASTQEVDRVLALDSITGRIGNTNSALLELVLSARSYADGLFGPVNESSGKGESGNPKMPSRIDGLSSAVSTTDELVATLRAQFERIRSL